MLPLLTTKLFPPPQRKKSIARVHLESKLDLGDDCRLLLVTAPAGFGKTTLVTSWLTTRQKRVAWVSLDKNDNDPYIFLTYLVEAAAQLEAGVCDSVISLLRSNEPPNLIALLTYMINDLACLQEPVTLVLDDYHVIYNAEVHSLVEFLLENGPAALQMVVISRYQPGFAVSRLRASHNVLEVSQHDIRFNRTETDDFLTDVMSLDLPDETVAELSARTEGWVTGLQLAALGMQRAPGDGFIHELRGDDRLIADYLIDEVLAQQPEEVRRFLTQTSILNRLSAPLCDALLECDNAQDLLMQVENANLFLIPLDNRRGWYRYHHLFGELLRSRLHNESPALISDLYSRAIEWHAGNGTIDEAVDYAIDSKDFAKAAGLLQSIVSESEPGRQRHQFITWSEKLPTALLRENEAIWTEYILTLFFYGDFPKALALLKSQETQSEQNEPYITDTLLAAIMVHMTLDAPYALEINRRVLEDFPHGSPLFRGIALGHSGSASLLLGDLPSAEVFLKDGLRLLDRLKSNSISLVFDNYLSDLEFTRGNLKRAFDTLRQSIHYAHLHSLQKGVSFSKTLVSFGLLHYEWNDLDEAAKLFEEGIERAEMSNQIDRWLHAIQALLQLQTATGTSAKLTQRLDSVEAIAADLGHPPLVMDRIGAFRSQVALHEGRADDAIAWAAAFAQRSDTEISCLQQIEWLSVVRVFLANAEAALVIPILEKMEALAGNEGRKRDQIEITVLLVRALYEKGDRNAACGRLVALLPLAEVEGFIRTFVNEGKPIFSLLTELTASNTHTALDTVTASYIRRLCRAFPPAIRDQSQNSANILTPREQTILELLSKGLTYSQIEEQLSITENTLKTHIKHIYGKLDVHNRTHATLAAQRVGIL